MQLQIALLGGDGIGPEVVAQAIKCLKAVEDTFNHRFIYKKALFGGAAMQKFGVPLPEQTLQLCKDSDAVLSGTIGLAKYNNDPNAKIRPEQGLLQLRKELDLFANIRPVKMFSELIGHSPLRKDIVTGTDFVIFRELTGGIYFGEKKLSADGTVASDLCEYSEYEISRIAHLAFKAAKKEEISSPWSIRPMCSKLRDYGEGWSPPLRRVIPKCRWSAFISIMQRCNCC